MHMRRASVVSILGALCILAAVAVPSFAAARGPITLRVDAREAPGKMLHAALSIPAAPGPLTLV